MLSVSKGVLEMTPEERRQHVLKCLRDARAAPPNRSLQLWMESTSRITQRDLNIVVR